MDKETAAQLKDLISNEIKFREEFRALREKLEYLVDPISEHVYKCNKFWEENFPKISEIVVIMNNGTNLKITRPKQERAVVETFLPYGIDFQECEIVNVE